MSEIFQKVTNFFFIKILIIASMVVLFHDRTGNGSAIRKASPVAREKRSAPLVVDYNIVGSSASDEDRFQRDIEDITGHMETYHQSGTDQYSHNVTQNAVVNNRKQTGNSRQVHDKEIIKGLKTVQGLNRNTLHNKSDDGDSIHKANTKIRPIIETKKQANVTLVPEKRLPKAIVIGVKKAGTRALLEFLKMHPDIKAPGPEPHFFDKNYDKGLDWYRNQMPVSLPHQLTIEKTPSYYVTKEVPARVHNMSRDIKLLVVVRDPVTRALSDYTQQIARNPNLKPFERMAFTDNATEVVNTSWAGIKIGIYVRHLEKWLEYFGLKQIHFVDGELLISQPAKELFKVQQFLAVKTVINDTHFSFNSTKGFPCLVKPQSKGRPHCLNNTKGRIHPRVSEKATQTLKHFYKPFNERLYKLLGQNFRW